MAQPRARPPQLAPLAGDLRRRQGQHLRQPARRRRRHRLRRRPRGDAPPRRRARAPRHVRPRRRRLPRRGRCRWSAPRGEIAPMASMRRGLPHDVTNGLAAAALVLETGLADAAAVAGRAGLVRRAAAPHRARRRRRRRRLVQRLEGDDAARRGGGDRRLRPRRAHRRRPQQGPRPGADGGRARAHPRRRRHRRGERRRRRGVRRGGVPVTTASSMPEAVDVAGAAALPGDVVLLSPGCASFDWYPDGSRPAATTSAGSSVQHVGLAGHDASERAPAPPRGARHDGVASNGLRGRRRDERRRHGRCPRPPSAARASPAGLAAAAVSTERRQRRRLPVLFGSERVRFWDVSAGRRRSATTSSPSSSPLSSCSAW